MAELTPNLQLVKPTINGEDTENTWGYDLNSNFDILDDAVVQSRVSDGDKGDIIVSAQGELWQFDPTVVTPAGRGVIAVDPKAGLLEQNGATAFRKRGITVAQQPPSGGIDGDLWLQYNLALPPEVNWDVSSSFFNTRTEAAASDIPNTVLAAQTGGFDQPGDQLHALYARMNVVPPLPLDPLLYFRSVDRNKLDGGQDPVTGGYWKRVDQTNNVFDTKAAAEAVALPAATKSLLLQGYTTVGDAQQTLTCKRVNAMPTKHVGWVRTLDRYKADGTVDATDGGYWEYVYPLEGIRVEWFGGKADGVTDNSVAFHKAMRIIEIDNTGAGYPYYKGGPKILFGSPLGGSTIPDQINVQPYYCGATLFPDRSVHICGSHGANVPGSAGRPTRLAFPRGCIGIELRGWYNDAAAPGGVVPGVAGTVIENIYCSCQVPAASPPVLNTEHGISVGVRVHIINSFFGNFSGNGVHIAADVGVYAGSNANLSYFDRVWANSNAGHGFYTHGGDANACMFNTCSAEANQGVGFYEDSFLGNTYIACHTASNIQGSYRGAPLNGSPFVGCYAESDQPIISGGKGMFFGGLLASGVDCSGGATQYGGPVLRGTFKHTGPNTLAPDPIGYTVRPTNDSAWSIFNDENAPFFFRYEESIGAFGLSYLGTPAALSYAITGSNGSSLRTPLLPANVFMLPVGCLIGGTGGVDNMRQLASEADIPVAAGTSYLRGDVAFDRQTRQAGWICTADGVAGAAKWNKFGELFVEATSGGLDLPVIADGGRSAVQTMTVVGAAVGDYVDVVDKFRSPFGTEVVSWVSAPDTVSFQLHNRTGVAYDSINTVFVARVRKSAAP